MHFCGIRIRCVDIFNTIRFFSAASGYPVKIDWSIYRQKSPFILPESPRLISCYSSITNFALPTVRDLHDYSSKCGTTTAPRMGSESPPQAKNNASHLKNETARTIRFHLKGPKKATPWKITGKIWSHLPAWVCMVKGPAWRLTSRPSGLFVNSWMANFLSEAWSF